MTTTTHAVGGWRTGFLLTTLLAAPAFLGCQRTEQAGPSADGSPAATDTDRAAPDEASSRDSAASLQDQPGAGTTQPTTGPAAEVPPVKLVALDIQLPAPAFRGTPVPLSEPNVEAPRGEPRPPFLAPEGTVNLARDKAIACSDPAPLNGELDYVNDGDKEASDFGYLELRPGTEWVQVDLGEQATIYAVLLWHNHAEARVYRDVVVQVSDDPDFLDGQTVYNNDYDNSSGLGIGQQMGYVETSEGKLIDCKGVEGRYVRFYSKGSNVDDKNHYTEFEVFGRPAA